MANELELIKPEVSAIQSRDMTVTDEASATFVTETAVIASRLYARLEAKRKSEVEELNRRVKEINGRFKPLTDLLSDIKNRAKAAVAKWTDEQERKAREEQARIEREREEARQRELAAAQEKGVEAPEVPLDSIDEPTPPPPKVVHGDTGSATKRKDWDFETINLSQVPAQYLQLDTVAVRRAIRDGVREIPGLRIFQKTNISVRS